MSAQSKVKRSTFLSTGVALLGASSLMNGTIRSASAEEVSTVSSSAKLSIVFCHGIWADGSSFSRVIPPLQAQGFEVIAAQYGLNTPEDDVAMTKHTMSRVEGPIILVGHSYGGSVITAAGMDDRVVGLVFIAALAPDVDAGETSASIQTKFPQTDVFKYVQPGDGRLWLVPDGVNAFCQDLSPEDQKLVWATHYAPDAALFNRNAPGTAWKTKPSWYIVAKNDRTVQPDLERFLAKRMNAKVTEADSSHVVMLSKPQVVVDVILQAANARQTAAAGT
jgi:pimeloyl-ACP methyl ester carboxylesterase